MASSVRNEFSGNRLYGELRDKDSSSAHLLDEVLGCARRLWADQYLVKFTGHGMEHITEVARRLDELTRPIQEGQAPLSPHEILALLSACCLHDIGMQSDDDGARGNHATHSRELIEESSAFSSAFGRQVTLPIESATLRGAIARIAEAHWATFAVRLEETTALHNNTTGRQRLLGLLLAMADLLDMSPQRARYFLTGHRLQSLERENRLHQVRHNSVTRCKVLDADGAGRIRYRLEWANAETQTEEIARWTVNQLTCYWRTLHRELEFCSGGTVRWTEPWVSVEVSADPLQTEALDEQAVACLRAEIESHRCIDREAFKRDFLAALQCEQPKLWVLHGQEGHDGAQLVDWCLAQARTRERWKTIQLDGSRESAPEVSTVAVEALAQLQQEASSSSLGQLVAQLGQATGALDEPLMSAVTDGRHDSEDLHSVLRALLKSGGQARMVVWMPSGYDLGVPTFCDCQETVLLRPFTKGELVAHLADELGYPPTEAEEVHSKVDLARQLDSPERTYLELAAWTGEVRVEF